MSQSRDFYEICAHLSRRILDLGQGSQIQVCTGEVSSGLRLFKEAARPIKLGVGLLQIPLIQRQYP